jgi:hypothetical protein
MVTVNAFVAVSFGEDESVTSTVKAEEPAVVGVPEMVPARLKVRPAGKAPDEMVQAYGVSPPVAAKVDEYAVPLVPFGSDEVVIESGCTEFDTVSASDLVALCLGEDESSSLTVKVDDPVVVGVPEIVPAALRLRPAGKAPEETLQL